MNLLPLTEQQRVRSLGESVLRKVQPPVALVVEEQHRLLVGQLARVTTEASAVIQAAKAAGKSSREIAAELKDQLGIELDQRTISRHVALIEGRKQKRQPKRAGKAPGKAKAKPVAVPATSRTEPLNEIKTLEARAREFEAILQQKLPLRDRIAASKELRDCFAQIRAAQGGPNGNADGKAAQDAAWVVQKLRRLVKNTPETPPEAAAPNGEESGAAHGS